MGPKFIDLEFASDKFGQIVLNRMRAEPIWTAQTFQFPPGGPTYLLDHVELPDDPPPLLKMGPAVAQTFNVVDWPGSDSFNIQLQVPQLQVVVQVPVPQDGGERTRPEQPVRLLCAAPATSKYHDRGRSFFVNNIFLGG